MDLSLRQVIALEREAVLLNPQFGRPHFDPIAPGKFQPISLQPKNALTLDRSPPPAPSIQSALSPGCQLVTVQWNAVPSAARYRLYRDGIFVEETAEAQTYDWRHLSPQTTYRYQVSAVDPVGNESSRSVEVSATTSTCDFSHNQGALETLVIGVKFPDLSYEPFPPSHLQDFVFGSGNSLDTQLRANSYSRSHLTGSVLPQWISLPHPAAHYCGNVGPITGDPSPQHWAWACSLNAMVPDVIRAIDPQTDFARVRHLILVWNRAGMASTVGYRGYGQAIRTQEGPLFASVTAMSSGYFNPANPRELGSGLLLHEFGHALGIDFRQGWEGGQHGGNLFCGGTSVPIPQFLTDLVRSGCGYNEYGDPEDPMGRSKIRHFSIYRKELMGLVSPDRSAIINEDGTYYIDAIENPSQLTQEIRIPLDNHGHLYTLDYRADLPPGIDVRLRLPYQLSGSLFAVTTLRAGNTLSDRFRGLEIEYVSPSQQGAGAKVIVRGVGSQSSISTPVLVRKREGISLDWQPANRTALRSTIEYRIYRDSALVAITTKTEWTDTDDLMRGSHCYSVSAYEKGARILTAASPEACLDIR